MRSSRMALACTLVAGLLGAPAARAEAVKLKLAMFSADTEMTWVKVIRPWAEQVNEAGRGVVEIEMFPNGALSRALPEQAQLVLNGVADIAFVIPGVTPGRFPENEVIELPGLFRSSREATEVYTHLMAEGRMPSFAKYHVVGAMGTPPFEIDSRTPVTSLATLAGKKIRVTNSSQGDILKRLGAVPVLIPVNQVAEAIGRGTVDGATEFPGPLLDFGIDRVTKYTYFLPVGVTALTVLMNREKFDSLPKPAQDILRKYSGEWVANQFVTSYGTYLDELYAKLKVAPGRTLTDPTPADMATAEAAFAAQDAEWATKAPGNAALLQAVRDELAVIRKR